MVEVLKTFEELSGKEVYEICKLRNEIFIVEQNCPYLDLDGNDEKCLHLYFFDDVENEIICYCRIIPKGITYTTASIGRIVANQKYRKMGYTREMLTKAIEIIEKKFREKEITIGAQNYLRKFYSSLGFIPISEVYDEDGIPHVTMKLKK
ncbi:GNAT family N-acetyltransferase [Fusobacterium perfoetens]|uniref:GNAT family N-acetyltransferase n=1 Tax=Fusobacterium perfoetens TaxID=852 RepID=UPI0004807103|nr:GNAT family N-acetyltransferase [Fusobacterium perfoetens]